MKLKDLVDQCGFDEIFQVLFGDADWDTGYDVVRWNSILLEPFYECKLASLTAISNDIFRFILEDPK